MPTRSHLPALPRTDPVEHRFPAFGVDVFESQHADGWRMDRAQHDFLKVIFVLQGRGALVDASGRAECHAGQALVVARGSSHQLEDRAGTPMSLYVVSIEPQVLRVACLDEALLPTGVVDLAPGEAERVERGMRRLLFEQTLDLPTTGPSMVSQALRLLIELARIDPNAERPATRQRTNRVAPRDGDSTARMEAYVSELGQHFFEATSLDAGASALGLSRRRFTQLFREVAGTSWLSHVRRLRIEHAQRLLRTTPRTVLSVAFECGFDDLSTFYRTFKRETGISPNGWRSVEAKTDARE